MSLFIQSPSKIPGQEAADTSPQPPHEKSVAFYALGCRANQLEASALADEFKAHGWQITPFEQAASLYVINTCTVTHGGDSDSRNIIRKAANKNPQAKIAVTGCYAQVSPEEVAAIDGVDFVIGNNFKQDIRHIIEASPRQVGKHERPEVHIAEIDKSRIMHGASASAIDRSRASLKIQDGCDFQCTYCIIWVARGKSRSLPEAVIETQFKQLLDAGFQEIVLTGINIGQYEAPASKADLTALLQRLIQLPGNFRIRLSSLDPFEVTPELIALVASSDKLCNYFHLSIQSLDDGILKRMGRRHHVADVEATCNAIKTAMPNAFIGCDMIIGFPGEDEAAYQSTKANFDRLPIDSAHVFSYSKRKDTPAADFDGQVSEQNKKQRSGELIALAKAKQLAHAQQQIGQTCHVIVEGNGRKGLSDNYIVIQWPQSAELAQRSLQPVKIDAVTLLESGKVLATGTPL